MKRKFYTDGWHDRGSFAFYVEDGRLIRGQFYGEGAAVYPYRYDPEYHCLANVSGVSAYYGVLKTVCWY